MTPLLLFEYGLALVAALFALFLALCAGWGVFCLLFAPKTHETVRRG